MSSYLASQAVKEIHLNRPPGMHGNSFFLLFFTGGWFGLVEVEEQSMKDCTETIKLFSWALYISHIH
jgi:hypothetical protein